MKPVGAGSTSTAGVVDSPPKGQAASNAAKQPEEIKQRSVDPAVSKSAQDAINNDPAAIARQLQLLGSPATDVKMLTEKAASSKLDGAAGISKSEYETIQSAFKQGQKNESVKWLEKNHPHLHASLVSGLNYEGYVGTTIGSLNSNRAGDDLKQDAAKRSDKLNQLPPLHQYGANGLPNTVPGADPLGKHGDSFKPINGYKTGSNYTKIIGDDLANISDADANKSRQTQKDFTTKMSGITGTDVPNPPSAKAAQAYFQGMADRGASPQQIKKEYGEYLKTFYRHPGGVDWNPKLDPKNIDSSFKQQPIAKDGKRLIDCEGFSALTESVLGGIKKNGQPMFDIYHAGSKEHVVAGVFPHGGDLKKGFIVDNESVKDISLNPLMEKQFNSTSNTELKKQYLLRTHMDANKEGTAESYGESVNSMKSPHAKVKQ